MTTRADPGFPPAHVTTLLRIEGAAVFAVALVAFHQLGGNWWLFALLILAPDLSMLGLFAGPKAGARIYNYAHTYSVPLAIGAVAWFLGAFWLLPYAVIWVAHIGADRALGYGLKYDGFHATHLGLIGKAKAEIADTR